MKCSSYISIIFIAYFSGFASPQNIPADFDPAFLSSLPESIQKDLLDKVNQESKLESPQYRRPSTFIKKPDPTSLRFGADMFSMMQSTMMPINEANFDGSYILDFGDELELQLIGKESSTVRLPIGRDGSVSIKDMGKIFLSGKSLEAASQLIESKVNQTYIGVEGYLTLVNIRDIQVTIAGNAFNPGIYTLNGNSNSFHALSVSGGPSDKGSFRKIDLIRNGEVIENIDLYETFIFARPTFDKRLRSGDIIFIHPVNNVVTASGAFKRPGTYELLESENLSEVITFANGINAYADFSNMQLLRIVDGAIKSISISNISQLDSIVSLDADRVFIRGFPFKTVEIKGSVLNPGSYLMREGDTIFDAIKASGGFLENAYLYGTVYENAFTRGVNEKANSILYNKFLENLLELVALGPGTDVGSIIPLVTQLKNVETSGRIIVDFSDEYSDKPALIQDGDSIVVPERYDQVYLYGEVSSQGASKFVMGQNPEYYLKTVGGLNKYADKESIFIYQPNGETLKYKPNRNIFASQNKNIEIYPGSIIYVPREVSDANLRRLTTQAYAAILGNLGISLASISVLKD